MLLILKSLCSIKNIKELKLLGGQKWLTNAAIDNYSKVPAPSAAADKADVNQIYLLVLLVSKVPQDFSTAKNAVAAGFFKVLTPSAAADKTDVNQAYLLVLPVILQF